jgi:hypothetical protein
MRVLGAAESVKFGGEVTVSCAEALMPSEDTVMVEVPAAIPVAKPVALMAAIAELLLANLSEAPAKELPYWSLDSAVNCWVSPTSTDAVCGVRVIEDKEGGASLVETGVGLPPQPTNKRRTKAMDARDDRFHLFSLFAVFSFFSFFSVIAKFVALDRGFLHLSGDVHRLCVVRRVILIGFYRGAVQSPCQLQDCAAWKLPVASMLKSIFGIPSSETT